MMMRKTFVFIFVLFITLLDESQWVLSKKPPSRPPKSGSRPSSGGSKTGRLPPSSTTPRGKKRGYEVEEIFDEDDDDMMGYEDYEDDDEESDNDFVDDDYEDDYDDYEDERPPVSRRVPPTKSQNLAREATMRKSSKRSSSSSRPPVVEDDDDDDFGGYNSRSSKKSSRPSKSSSRSRQQDDDYEDEYRRPPKGSSRSPSGSSSSRPPKSGGGSSKRRPQYNPPPSNRRPGGRPPPGRGGRPRHGSGRNEIVSYRQPSATQKMASSLSKGFAGLASAMPDPQTVRAFATNSINTAKETTNSLSANIYREVKGLTSSELEQVMLKATRPDDTPVKGKHVERLVGVTYQVSVRYDIYDAVLRKLWKKMAEKDWRTTMKALYIMHRFSADGAPEHAPALKARLRELRRTRDPKRKAKYFDTKLLLAGSGGDINNPDTMKYRAYMSRYAHYVLLRAQCFGGMFEEISTLPKIDKKKKQAPKPITSTSLRTEHLDAAVVLLKAGLNCQLKNGEECENCAIATERVASDMIGLTTSVAIALNRALKDDDLKGADPVLLKKWCLLYRDELLPKTRAMVKKTSPKLDPYGLFLPSRMGTTVPQDILEKGLNLEKEEEDTTAESDDDKSSSTTQDEGGEQKEKATEEQDQEEDDAKEEDDVGNDEEEEEENDEDDVADDDAEEFDAVDEEEEEDEYDYEYEEDEYFEDEED